MTGILLRKLIKFEGACYLASEIFSRYLKKLNVNHYLSETKTYHLSFLVNIYEAYE